MQINKAPGTHIWSAPSTAVSAKYAGAQQQQPSSSMTARITMFNKPKKDQQQSSAASSSSKGSRSNVTKTGSPFVSSGYMPHSLSESFANATQNIGSAIRQIPGPMLFTQRMTRGAKELSQFIANAGRAGIANGLQQLARSRCSLDGTGGMRLFPGPR